MPIVNRDYLNFEASIIVCLCKQHIAQYFGDSDNCIIEYPTEIELSCNVDFNQTES